MIFNRNNPIRSPNPTKPIKEKERACRHKIRRDESGRVVDEQWINCTKDEIKMMKDDGQ